MEPGPEVDIALAALADPTRRMVIELLLHSPRRTSELAELIGVTVPAVSRHLRVLRDKDIIERADVAGDGRGREYRLKPDRLKPLARWLDADHWASELPETTHPDAAEFLARVGGFLDGFAQSNTDFFRRHLAEDVALVFPGSSRVWDRASVIESVADHAPYIEWRISDSSVRPLGPGLTLVVITTVVRTSSANESTPVVQSMLFDDTSDPWTLRFLQQTAT